MKTLLRSTFAASPKDNLDYLFRNYLHLYNSGLGFDIYEDEVIWNFVRDFSQTHSHVPDIATLRTHFSGRSEDEVVDRLEMLSGLPPLVRGDFIKRLEERAEDRRTRRVQDLLRDAGTILMKGMEIKQPKEGDKILRGPQDAVSYILQNSHDIVASTIGGRLSGEVTSDGEDFVDEYLTTKADPLAGLGQFSGLKQMDVALGGLHRQELWVHAAFTGGLKSTLALNWMYTQSVYYGESSCIFSLEMPYKQCRRILYSMHSLHPKFNEIRMELGLQDDSNTPKGLPYKYIKNGSLTEYRDNAERFLMEYVVPDFNSRDNEYGNIHIEVADPDKSDFTMADLKQRAELIYSKDPFSMLVVDHVGLMSPRKWVPSTTDRLNEVIKDLKKLALAFNKGQGMGVLALFQISRDGYKSAMKLKEKTGVAGYNLTHLSYANEAERSGDVVSAGWTDDDLRKQNRLQIQCLKSRDDEPFETFYARVEWENRRLLTTYDMPMSADQKRQLGDDIDNDPTIDGLL